MAKRTKKVGPAGRYQARYGVRARTQIKNVEIHQRLKHLCPSCGHQKVKRVSAGIWQCGKCRVKFAGGAYYPRTESGQNIEKMIKGEVEAPVIKPEPEKKDIKDEGEKA